MRRNPFEDIETALEQMQRQFEENLGSAGAIVVDVLDRDDEYVVTADLPGFATEDIDVTLTDDRLEIEAERSEDATSEGEDYLVRERRRDRRHRTIRLPEPVEEEAVDADYTDGVLTVTLPKTSVAETGRRIDIE